VSVHTGRCGSVQYESIVDITKPLAMPVLSQ
jgi:hypothetical protein